MGYLPQVFTSYMGVGYAASLAVLLLLAGSWSAVRESSEALLLAVGGAIILRPVLMSLQGVSVFQDVGLRPLSNLSPSCPCS